MAQASGTDPRATSFPQDQRIAKPCGAPAHRAKPHLNLMPNQRSRPQALSDSSQTAPTVLALVACLAITAPIAGQGLFPGNEQIGHGWDALALKPEAASKHRIVTYKAGKERVPTQSSGIPGIGDIPTFMHAGRRPAAGYSSQFADSFASLSRKLSVTAHAEVDSFGFQGSLDTKFSESTKTSAETQVASIQKHHTAFVLEFGDIDDLEEHLDRHFKRDLDDSSFPPEDLFAKHGTHVVTKVLLGGRLDYWFSSKSTESMSSKAFEASVKASYGGVSGGASLTAEEENLAKASSVSMTMNAVGGEGSAISSLEASKTSDAFATWAASIQTNPHYIGRPKDGLVAVWDLCSNNARATELRKAYHRLAAKRIIENPVIFTHTSDDVGEYPVATWEVPSGYKILSGGAKTNAGRVGLLLVSSYPTNGSKGWAAQGRSIIERDTGTLTIRVLAIHDPDNYWDVQHWPSERSELTQHPRAFAEVKPGYALTGGGVLCEAPNGGVGTFPWLAHPVFKAHAKELHAIPGAARELEDHAKARSLYENHEGQAQELSGWACFAKDFAVPAASNLTAFAIGVQPNPANRHIADGGLAVMTAGFVGHKPLTLKRSLQKSSLRVADGYTLVGGGAVSPDCRVLLTGSLCEPAVDRARGPEWTVLAKDHLLEASYTPVYVFAIGLQVLAK